MIAYAPYQSTTSTMWYRWQSTSDTTATSFTASDYPYSGAWYSWNDSTNAGYAVHREVRYYRQELAAVQRRRDRSNRAAAEVRDKAERARRAAEQLLFAHLTEEQKAMYRRMKKFRVVSSKGQVFELDATKRFHNVFLLGADGKRKREYCLDQRGRTPMADAHLAQKLLLEADESMFRQIANSKLLVG